MSVSSKSIAARLARLKSIELVASEILDLFAQAQYARGRANAADIALPDAASILQLPERRDARAAIERTRRNLLQLTPETGSDEIILL